nr:hypothetical protein [Cytophagales bacterium]
MIAAEPPFSSLMQMCLKIIEIEQNEEAYKSLFGSIVARNWHIYFTTSENTEGKHAYIAGLSAAAKLKATTGNKKLSNTTLTALLGTDMYFKELGNAWDFFKCKAFDEFKYRVDVVYAIYCEERSG